MDRETVMLRGIPLALHPPGDWVSDRIRRTRDFYEAPILDELRRRVTGGVLVDAGAMIGNHSAYFAAFLPHSAIHAFEPHPGNRALLSRNVARFPTVTVHPEALSDRAQRLDMAFAPDNLGHGVVTASDPWPQAGMTPFRANSVTLDSLDLRDVTLIKIDVEWHEPQVIAGARETIARCHPLIVIEDWRHEYAALLPGYRLAAEWETAHQTFLYEWAA